MGANNIANPANDISPSLLTGGINPSGNSATESQILTNLSITFSLPQPVCVVGGLTTGGLGGVATDGVQGGGGGPYLGPPPVPSSQYFVWKNPAAFAFEFFDIAL